MLLTIARIASLVIMLVLLLSCGGSEELVQPAQQQSETSARMKALSVTSSGTVMDVQLPFVDGVSRECYQNSNDTPTHQHITTISDLDFAMPVGSIVVAAAAGRVTKFDDASKTGGFGWYIRIDHDDGRWTIYAHLSGFIANTGDRVVAGQPIAYSGGNENSPGAGKSTGAHLHFGIHQGGGVGESKRMSVYALDRNTGIKKHFVTGDEKTASEFVCAVYSDGKKLTSGHFYESHPIGQAFSNYQCRKLSDGSVLCWQGNPVDCLDGSSHVWYHKDSDGAYVSSSANKHQKCSLSTSQSANVFSYLEGGFGVGGYGPGSATEATEPPEPQAPDLIVRKVWLETPWGNQVNLYGTNERPLMKAQIENIGDGPPRQTVPGVFILSRGYFKDPQGERRVVGSDETQPSNLGPGSTHTETESLDIMSLGLSPGVWNAIYCVNRDRDDNTTSGAYEEKHKSNNCSTEAVFEIVAGTVNTPYVDLVPAGFTLLQHPLYQGGQIRVGSWVRNQGTMDALTGIRSTYTVSCNGGPSVFLTDDGTDQAELKAGGSVWEEIRSAVTMPDVVGTCVLTYTVDAGNAQAETDESNNTATLSITLAPRPLPDLIITFIEIDPWPDASIKKGKTHHPTLKVKNVGSGPVTSTTRQAYYWYGPSTNHTWQRIADDGTEPAELCVGCEVTETIHSGFTATKKGVHYLKACADSLGNQPETEESNNCLMSRAITVK